MRPFPNHHGGHRAGWSEPKTTVARENHMSRDSRRGRCYISAQS